MSPANMSDRAPGISVGTVIAGKWTLDEVLGFGSSAVVFGATHRNGNRVAIKVMRAEIARRPDLVARFAREGHVGNLIDHLGVVRTLDDGRTDDGVPYLVMERLHGEPLDRRIAASGSLPLAHAARILDAVLDTLAAAHACGLLHRDVKPSNVFLLREGGVKLLDFGIARERVLAPKGDTALGVVFGTPAFMPPEQARGRWDQVGPWSDLWSAAATFFTALTGRLLIEGTTPTEELVAALHPVGPVRRRAPELSPEVARFLDSALAYDPASRFASATKMRAALRETVPFSDASMPGAGDAVAVEVAAITAEPRLALPLRWRGAGRWVAVGGAAAVVTVLAAVHLVRCEHEPAARASTSTPSPSADVPAPPMSLRPSANVLELPQETAKPSLPSASPARLPSRAESHAAAAVPPRASASGGPKRTPDALFSRF